jgi:hypothetical protein
MIDVGSSGFKRSLADVIRWCATLPFPSEVNDSTLRRMYEDANRLFDQAMRAATRDSQHRSPRQMEQAQEGQRLLAEILQSLGPLDHAFRSAELKPHSPVGSDGGTRWADLVTEVVETRARRLEQRTAARNQADGRSGRLLLYFPRENLACGAAQVSSGGLYDVDNVPPWDLWVAFIEDTLVSWIPPRLLEAAQMGIDVNPENCIQWIDP